MRHILAALMMLLSLAGPALGQSVTNTDIFEIILFSTARSGGTVSIRRPAIRIVGSNESIGLINMETVWPPGGLRPRPSGLTSMEIVSLSPLDTLAGTGCQVFGLNGLGIDGAEIAQLISMNGTSPAAIPIQLFRIQPSGCVQPGSLRRNAGDISIQAAGGGTVFGFVLADKGGAHTAAFTVPLGTVFVLKELGFSTKDDFAVEFFADFPGVGIRSLPFQIQGQIQIAIDPPVCYEAGTEIESQARSTTGNAPMTSTFSGWLVDGGECS